jgi:hypothetical protein
LILKNQKLTKLLIRIHIKWRNGNQDSQNLPDLEDFLRRFLQAAN